MADFGFETTAEEAAMTFASEIKGKTVLMTGVSPGSLGAEVALQIARQQTKLLILTGRNLAKVRETETAIKSIIPDASIRLLELDLASQKQIKQAAEEANSYPEPINVLITSAAIMAAPYSLTEDRLESQFGTNHIGHFLFTNLIMGKILQAGKGSRIVNVSSHGHRRSGIRWNDYNFGDGDTYDKWPGYGQGKTANILFSVELAEKLGKKGVQAYSLHPGGINTPLSKHMTEEDRKATGWFDENGNPNEMTLSSGKRSRKAHQRTLLQHLILASQVRQKRGLLLRSQSDTVNIDQNGGYLTDCQVHMENCFPHAKDKDAAARLWTLSETIVGQEFLHGNTNRL